MVAYRAWCVVVALLCATVVAAQYWPAVDLSEMVCYPERDTAEGSNIGDIQCDADSFDINSDEDIQITFDADSTAGAGDFIGINSGGGTLITLNEAAVIDGSDIISVTSGPWTFKPNATGQTGQYDIVIGSSSDHGAMKIGNTGIYASNYTLGGTIDLGQTFLFRQEGNLDASNDPGIEFAWMESNNDFIRLAIPESGSGNATAFIRSGTFAGPYTTNKTNDIVTCNHWSAYDLNIDCDTTATGADLFIQDDLEVEGTIFAHETINLEGTTADGNHVIVQVGADPGADITLSLPTSTGTIALEGGGLRQICRAIEDLDSSDTNVPFWSPNSNITLSEGWCICTGTCTTEADITLETRQTGTASTVDENSNTINCEDEATAVSETDLTASAQDVTVDALDLIRFDVDNTPTTGDYYLLCVTYNID